MKTYNNSSHVQYAVIQVRESDSGIERLVISYHDERILRQFLAKRSIVATGFSTRDEATKDSFAAGIGKRGSLWSEIFWFRELPRCHQVRMLKTQMLSRLPEPTRRRASIKKCRPHWASRSRQNYFSIHTRSAKTRTSRAAVSDTEPGPYYVDDSHSTPSA